MDFRKTRYEGVDWIEVAQDRVQQCTFVKIVMNLCA
jgi:hypothetical protein